MNNEAKLLSRVIEERNLGYVLEQGITDSWFTDSNDKRLFIFMRDHYTEYQECPSIEVIRDNFPTFQLLDTQDNLQYYIDKLIETRRKATIIETLSSAITAIETNKDHEAALISMQRGMITLEEQGLNHSNDLEVTTAAKLAKEEYEYRKANPGLLGLATGFPTIDASTSGLQPEQLVVIVATPKTGKSTLALQIAVNAHLAGKVPMFMSFEMSNAEQKSRYYAMRAKISHRRLMTGTLTDDEELRYYELVNSMQDMTDKFWFVDSTGGQTVSAIASKIQSKNPDIVFIDGAYLLIDEQTGEANTPQAITNITRSLKRLAQKVKKPIIISTQVLAWKMRGGNVTADSIGYSSSFHQDADVIFGLQKIDENIDDMRLLRVIASRNSGFTEASLTWDWNTGTFREMDENDLSL